MGGRVAGFDGLIGIRASAEPTTSPFANRATVVGAQNLAAQTALQANRSEDEGT